MVSNDSFAINPFTLIFDALWSLFEQSPVFTTDVALGNRIHFNFYNDPNPLKPQIQDSDLPEVILISAGTNEINLYSTSATSKIVKRYQVMVATGDLRIQNYLNQIQWDLYCAFTGWTTLLGALIWPVGSGRTFVKRCALTDCEEGLDNTKENRGIIGWSSIWSAEVECHFLTSDLINYRGY